MTPLVPKPELTAIFCFSASTLYSHIARGVLPPPIKTGPQGRAWIRAEIEAIMRARVAGQSESEIKELVLELTAARHRPN